MDEIKSWAFSVCAAAVVGGIVVMLSPRGGTGKTVKTAVSLFLLCVMLRPFMSGYMNRLSLDSAAESRIGTGDCSAAEYTVGSMKDALREKTDKILSDNGVKNSRTDIEISIDGDNNMSIDRVAIYAPEQYAEELERAKEEIYSQLGIRAETGVLG